MLIKEIIENYIRQNNAVAFFLKETGADCLSFDETLPLFIEKLKEDVYKRQAIYSGIAFPCWMK